MKTSKSLLRTGVLVLSAFFLAVFQVSLSSILVDSPAYAQPFATLPPNTATLNPAGVVGTPVVPTPIPTIGPGQSFTEGQEELLPELLRPDLLDSDYGYSEILGKPGLFLVWSTDEYGTKSYFVLQDGNDYLNGIINAVDRVRTDALEMKKELPWWKAIGGTLVGLALGAVGIVWGLGAVASLAATPISAPVTGLLAACAGGAFTMSAGAFGMAVDGAGRIFGHFEISDEARKEIRGAFLQIPYSEQP